MYQSPAAQKFLSEADALKWFWENSMIPRPVAIEMLRWAPPKYHPKFQSSGLSAEQIVEILALTLAVTIKFVLSNEEREFQKRLSVYRQYLESSRTLTEWGWPIPTPTAKDTQKIRDRLYKGTPKGPKKNGRRPKNIRDKAVARLIGFLEFSSGEPAWKYPMRTPHSFGRDYGTTCFIQGLA
jgi:hypothetical protein